MRYAISDIHGTGRAFLKLLDHVDPDPEELVICGDLGDRGLETWEVYEECSMLLDEGATIVMGNHDLWFEQYRSNSLSREAFTDGEVGGLTTLKSIGVAIHSRIDKGMSEQQARNEVNQTIDKVLSGMVPYYETDDYIFVHAGLNPHVPYMEDQKYDDLIMGNKDFKNPRMEHPFEQVIVFGHTPTPLIHRDITEDEATIWFSRKARKMCIDTGAGFGCRLTLADLYDGIAYAYDFAKREIIEYQFKRKERRRRRYY